MFKNVTPTYVPEMIAGKRKATNFFLTKEAKDCILETRPRWNGNFSFKIFSISKSC